jgi:hypothetical protein
MSPDVLDFAEASPARLITDIEALLRREGARLYGAGDSAMGFYRTQLCGVNAHLVPRSGIRRLYTVDLDIAIAPDGDVQFARGNVATLRAWHRHLTAYRKALRSSTAIAA